MTQLRLSQFAAALRRRLGEAGAAVRRAIGAIPIGRLISIAIIAGGLATVVYVERRISDYPYTDDATIDADVVHVAAAVGGRILELPVTENAKVSKGDLLFRLDPEPYRLAAEQAEANLDVAIGALDTRRRTIATEKSSATITAEQVKRAQTNFQLASRTTERLRPLAARSFVPIQQFDQAETAQRDAATSLRQAREQEAAALQAIGTEQAAIAAVEASKAALGIARRALDDTVVRAWHDGRVVGLTVLAGEMVVPSQSLFTLISTEDWYAVANFRETDLHAISVGNCATVFSMIDRRKPIKGVVEGIGWGVLDADRVNLPRSAPYVQRSMNWVRVAQRFPVRIRLQEPPEQLVRLGASAVVEIKHGDACS
ncbi:MAG TPA: multidrug transporter subunit MdtN [Methylocystis sp.]|nr:multidrug transporter subunit MdtN [Methylocystis sp.]